LANVAKAIATSALKAFPCGYIATRSTGRIIVVDLLFLRFVDFIH
jgi:hypothetical protein